MKLDEWTTQYIKFQDCMKKQIQSIETTPEGFFVSEKKETKEYKIIPALGTIPTTTNADKCIIITYNNLNNVEAVQKQWETLVGKTTLTFLFVNTKTNEKWHLQPATHQKITEDVHKSLLVLQESIATQTE